MKLSIKAPLFSAFILPGAGHILLKSYGTAFVLLGIAMFALYVLVTHAVERALIIVDKIVSGQVQPNVTVLAELVTKQPEGYGAQLIEYATSALIICWLAGIVDAYRVGRLQESNILRSSNVAADE